MAEDEEEVNDLTTSDQEGPRSPTAPRKKGESKRTKQKSGSKQKSYPAPKCRSRTDQLATPNRRLILALYQNYGDRLPKDKFEKIKVLLQELYAMTPEETEKYFDHLRQKATTDGRRKDIKYMLKRLMKRRKKAKHIKAAYEFITRLLVKGMDYASKNQIPPLVSVRLRNLSNIILEQICDLRNVNIPNRDDTDQVGYFLLQVADWMAIAIEHLYYGVQLKKNRELEKIDLEAQAREKENREEKSAIKPSFIQPDAEAEEGDAERVLSEELLLSEME